MADKAWSHSVRKAKLARTILMSFLTPIFVGAPPVPTEDLAKLTGRYIRDLLSYICLLSLFSFTAVSGFSQQASVQLIGIA